MKTVKFTEITKRNQPIVDGIVRDWQKAEKIRCEAEGRPLLMMTKVSRLWTLTLEGYRVHAGLSTVECGLLVQRLLLLTDITNHKKMRDEATRYITDRRAKYSNNLH